MNMIFPVAGSAERPAAGRAAGVGGAGGVGARERVCRLVQVRLPLLLWGRLLPLELETNLREVKSFTKPFFAAPAPTWPGSAPPWGTPPPAAAARCGSWWSAGTSPPASSAPSTTPPPSQHPGSREGKLYFDTIWWGLGNWQASCLIFCILSVNS